MKKFNMIVLVLLCFYLTACGVTSTNVQQDNTLRDTLLYAQSIYIEQYDDYLIQSERTDLNDAQKQILRTKREVLTSLFEKIEILKEYVSEGIIPFDAIEADILKLVSKLLEAK